MTPIGIAMYMIPIVRNIEVVILPPAVRGTTSPKPTVADVTKLNQMTFQSVLDTRLSF